jgi:endogenous inhibitor of DNA gyrase (YacG/DUF329 family)
MKASPAHCEPHYHRVTPEPQTEWSVTCPACAEPFDVELMPGIVDGAWGPAAEDQFQSCPECGALVEVGSVQVMPA